MWQRFLYKLNNTVMGSALILAVFSFLAKILALLRDRLIANNLGASISSDIYYAAFRLPDLIFNTLVLGALTSAFIPVFQRVWFKDKDQGLKLANSVLNFLLVFVGLLIILAIIFAGQLVPLFTPGFGSAELNQVLVLTRVMLIAALFFVVSNVVGGILNSLKKFFSFALAASFYNLGIIGVWLFYPQWGLIGLALGVLLGAVMHLLVQLPEAIKHGWRYQLSFKWTNDLKKILFLMVPRTIGLAASQINLVVITMIASTLSAGSIAVFNFASNIGSLPVSLIAVSMAIAVFPTFTQAVSQDNQGLFSENFSLSARRLLFILMPISVFMFLLRAQLVRVILGSGAFDWQATYYTAQTLGILSLSIFAQGFVHLITRAFYAHEDTKTPTIIGIMAIILNIILSFILAPQLGILGLALAFSIATIIDVIILYAVLNYRIKKINNLEIFNSLVKIMLNSLLAGFICYGGLQLLAKVVNMQTGWGIFLQGLGAGLMGLLSYLILSIVFRMSEIDIVWRFLKKFILLFKNGRRA